MLNKIIVGICLCILCNCSNNQATYKIKKVNGHKVILNTGKPSISKEKMNIKLSKVLEIKGDTDSLRSFLEPSQLVVDTKDNIYIYDGKSKSIKKYSNKGEFIKSFGQRGQGPGEYMFVAGITIYKDTIKIMDPNKNKLHSFNTDGKFLYSKNNQFSRALYSGFQSFHKSFLCNRSSFKQSDGNWASMKKDICLIKPDLKNIIVLDSGILKYPSKDVFAESKITKLFCCDSLNIFIADLAQKNKYEIKSYDNQQNLKFIIKKRYRNIPITKNELKNQAEIYINEGWEGKIKKDLKNYADYKYSILNIYTDNLNRLWVYKSSFEKKEKKENLEFDIFKDGIYLNSVSYKFDLPNQERLFPFPNYNIKFIKDKIYVINQDEAKISIYTY